MIAKVKARFSKGVLTPLEPLDLKEGAEVTVSVEETKVAKRGLRASAGGWAGMHNPEELIRMIYEARRTGSREEPAP